MAQPITSRSYPGSDLNLGVIGNCAFSALINRQTRIVWCCMPRFDGDPIFADLLGNSQDPASEEAGFFQIEVETLAHSRQWYLENTAVLVTWLEDADGSAVEVTDYAPRFRWHDRQFRPMTIVRRITPIRGTPRIRIRLRPTFAYNTTKPSIIRGSNHIRYLGPHFNLRLTTNAPVSYVLQETAFYLEGPIALFLGPDETMASAVLETADDFLEKTIAYWREWIRHLAIPLEWQVAVIRAAISLKLCSFEETGGIIAAMTTSIPEAPHSRRNWDYRFCWLRDAFFVVRALNRLGAIDIMEHYVRYLRNIIASSPDGHLQPVYGIGQEHRPSDEQKISSLPGYRGMGPVRIGNEAFEHLQHDVYGNVVLATAEAFFDCRLLRRVSKAEFLKLEAVGERAFKLHDQPDAGMWELRDIDRIHTSSSLMCWAACDRLAKIATHLALTDREPLWRSRADIIRKAIETRAWNEEKGTFTGGFGDTELDASLLLMMEVGFIDPDDSRFTRTVEAIEKTLFQGKYLFRYVMADDFGKPETAFIVCTFWYIDALVAMGRKAEAREIFNYMLKCRNHVGLFSEDIDPETHELWGNYPQTYSLVGIINSAMQLSTRWEDVL